MSTRRTAPRTAPAAPAAPAPSAPAAMTHAERLAVTLQATPRGKAVGASVSNGARVEIHERREIVQRPEPPDPEPPSSRNEGRAEEIHGDQSHTGQLNPWLKEYREQFAKDDQEIREELAKHAEQLAALRDLLNRASNDKLDMRTDQMEQIRLELANAKARNTALAKQLDASKDETTEAKAEAARFETQAAELEKQLQAARDELAAKTTDIGDLSAKVDDLEAQKSALEAQIADLLQKKAESDDSNLTEVDALKAELEKVNTLLNAAQKDLEEARAALEEAEAEFKKEMQRNQDILTELRARNAALEEEIEQLDIEGGIEDTDSEDEDMNRTTSFAENKRGDRGYKVSGEI